MPVYTVLLIVAIATSGTWGPKLVASVSPRPSEMTCGQWVNEPAVASNTVELVAQDFDAARLGRRAVEDVVRQQISTSCAEHDADRRPLNADLRGQISSKLRRLRAR